MGPRWKLTTPRKEGREGRSFNPDETENTAPVRTLVIQLGGRKTHMLAEFRKHDSFGPQRDLAAVLADRN
jgi:hypothetical protein